MPTSGINLLQCFNLLKNYNLKNIKFMSDEYIEILISILQKVLRDRRKYSSDPDFIKLNQSELISKKYLKSIASISLNNFEKNKLNLKDGGTTHFVFGTK